MRDRLALVFHGVDVCHLEVRRLKGTGPHFRIIHRCQETTIACLPGEEISWIVLIYRRHEYVLRLPLALLIFFDYLARNRRFPQSAAQITSGLRNQLFYVRHGANAKSGAKLTRRFSRGSIKEYVKRLRRAMEIAFGQAGLRLNASAVLVSQPTMGNESGYILKAGVEWCHI